MKAETIPFPRVFRPGDPPGVDMRAVKRALAVALGGPNGMSLKTNTFAKPAQAALVQFKKDHGLLSDPIYTQQAHAVLIGFFDSFGASLMNKAAKHYAALLQRETYVETWRWLIENRVPAHYAQIRPIPNRVPPFSKGVILSTDCSGTVTLAAQWSDLPDPNGNAYNGVGNTGTLLHHCLHVDIAALLPGDLIVYRDSPLDTFGHHVVGVLAKLPGGDYEIGSHGHEGDPESTTHSAMAASQARNGHPVSTGLRWLPTP